LRLGLEINFNPDRQVSTSLSEGKSLSPFDFLSVRSMSRQRRDVSSESHLYRDERVVKKDLALWILGRQKSVVRGMVLLAGTHFPDEPNFEY
jgi:hypothetical protein